jgi:hypothetical protein
MAGVGYHGVSSVGSNGMDGISVYFSHHQSKGYTFSKQTEQRVYWCKGGKDNLAPS